MHAPPLPLAALSTLLAASLSACHGHASGDHNGGPTTPVAQHNGQIPSPAANDPDAQNSALLAAAEPFEALTEQAYTGDTKGLDKLIAKARSSATAAKQYLPPDQATALAGHVSAVDAARSSNNRADLAIAAVEGYRTLVSNVAGPQKIPKQVSLLDYVGFRYQADLKATPIRWGDSAAALDFGDRQWRQIANTVGDRKLRSKMAKALEGMRAATRSKNEPAAMSASTEESNLVDNLEQYFGHA